VEAAEESMVVGRDYMLKKQGGPAAPKLFLDTKLVPAIVNVLGGVEVALERTSRRTGVSSRSILAGVTGVGILGLYRLMFHPLQLERSDTAGRTGLSDC
jgi:hypothetical protein